MAYVNVLDWKCEQVECWLRGLDDSIYPYCHYFVNNQVDGKKLLNLTVCDLIKLHVEKLGHQEIILEGLEQLKNLHYNLDIENLQYVALKLSWKSRSLFNEIKMQEDMKYQSPVPNHQKVDTSTMSFVAEVLDALMTMLSWLDKPPFSNSKDNQIPYKEFARHFIKIGIELATNAQRDTFAEKPMEVIKGCCQKIADLSDDLIKNASSLDSLILQPASLDVVTIKKSDNDFGLEIESQPRAHLISEVRFGSLAYRGGKIHAGDEIVQIHYQTVVGWTNKNVLQLLHQEQPRPEVILTLKKRPKHTFGGHLNMKPLRIPARHQTPFNNLPSPRAELLVAPEVKFPIKKKTPEKKSQDEVKEDIKVDVIDGSDRSIVDDDIDDDIDDEIYLPTSSSTKDLSPTQSVRSLLLRPRSTPIRRATISAGSPTKHQPYINVSEIWAGMFDTSRSNKSNNSDGGSKQSSTASSTMQSTDSGHATMYSPSMMYNVQDKYQRPITIGPEYINMMESSKNPKEDYINLFTCSTVGKRDPPPPPRPPRIDRLGDSQKAPIGPKPKPRLNVTLSRESSLEESPSTSSRKKRPVPQPRKISEPRQSLPPRSLSTSKVLMSSDVQPVSLPATKIYKKFPLSTSCLPEKAPLPVPIQSSSSEDDDLPPALPARQQNI